MKSNTEGIQKEYLVSNDMVQLGFKAESFGDLVSRYAVSGCEMPESGLIAYLDRITSFIPEKLPVVLEISGHAFNREEREKINSAIWNFYHIRLSEVKHEEQKARTRMIWYAVCMALSSVLLFMVNSNTDTLMTQLAYLPFWYFGCRLFPFIFITYRPQRQNTAKYEQLASMKVTFTNSANVEEINDAEAAAFRKEISENLQDREASDYSHVMKSFMLEKDGTFGIGCRISRMADVIPEWSIPGYEICSDDFNTYLELFMPYVSDKHPVRIEITGPENAELDEESIRRTIRAEYAFRLQKAHEEEKKGIHTILIFTAFTVITACLLFLYNKGIDAALSELIMVAFWYFADYLIELLLLDHRPLVQKRRSLEQMEKADIAFITEDKH